MLPEFPDPSWPAFMQHSGPTRNLRQISDQSAVISDQKMKNLPASSLLTDHSALLRPRLDAGPSIVSHPRMSEPKPKKPISSHRWVLGYLMREKAVFLPSLAALFFTAMLSLAFPWFLKELIGNPTDALKSGVDPAQVLAKSNRVVLELVAVLGLQAFIAFFRVQGFIHSGESALNRLRRDLFAHLVRLPMPFFQEQRSGALSNRVSADLGVVRDTLLNTVPQAVRQTVILIGGLIFIFVASWKLSR